MIEMSKGMEIGLAALIRASGLTREHFTNALQQIEDIRNAFVQMNERQARLEKISGEIVEHIHRLENRVYYRSYQFEHEKEQSHGNGTDKSADGSPR